MYKLTPNLILEGIKEEAAVQIKKSCGSSEEVDLMIDAIQNIQKTWDEIFSKLPADLRNKSIWREGIIDEPKHDFVFLILKSYTMETFLYSTLNEA